MRSMETRGGNVEAYPHLVMVVRQTVESGDWEGLSKKMEHVTNMPSPLWLKLAEGIDIGSRLPVEDIAFLKTLTGARHVLLLLLLVETPLSIKALSEKTGLDRDLVKKALETFMKKGLVYRVSRGKYAVLPGIAVKLSTFYELLIKSNLSLFVTKMGNEWVMNGEQMGNEWVMQHSLQNNNKNNNILLEKALTKAEEKLGRKLEPEEQVILEILVEHYERTGSLWLDPRSFEDRFYEKKTRGSSRIYQQVTLEDVMKAFQTLASHKIAYSIVENRRLKKLALHKPFINTL